MFKLWVTSTEDWEEQVPLETVKEYVPTASTVAILVEAPDTIFPFDVVQL